MPAGLMNVDELVAALKRTTLPTVLVEGRDDMTVYRWIEERLGTTMANVFPCGGRHNLLAVFDRRGEFPMLKCAFLADRDMWLFGTIPPQYKGAVFTSGYSIENDILEASPVHNLLSRTEKTEFSVIEAELARWFAFEIQEFRAGRWFQINLHINQLVPPGTRNLDPRFLADRGFREPHKSVTRSIRRNFFMRMRGKNVLQLYVRLLSASSRASKFSKGNLLEIGTKCGTSANLNRLIVLLKRKMT